MTAALVALALGVLGAAGAIAGLALTLVRAERRAHAAEGGREKATDQLAAAAADLAEVRQAADESRLRLERLVSFLRAELHDGALAEKENEGASARRPVDRLRRVLELLQEHAVTAAASPAVAGRELPGDAPAAAGAAAGAAPDRSGSGEPRARLP